MFFFTTSIFAKAVLGTVVWLLCLEWKSFESLRTNILCDRTIFVWFADSKNSYFFISRVRHLPVEDMGDCILPPHMEKEITSSRLQLILLSPTLLQFLARNSNVVIGRLLHPDRVIAIMLGVRDNQITGEYFCILCVFTNSINNHKVRDQFTGYSFGKK